MVDDDAFAKLQDTARQLQQDLDRERQERERTTRDVEGLQRRLLQRGSKFLVDLEYRLVHEATVSVAAGTVVVGAVFDTLPGTLHAVYVLSAYAPSSNTPAVITDGSVIVAPANAVSVGVQRQRQTTPLRIEASVIYDNTGGAAASIAVRVWRRLGMGS